MLLYLLADATVSTGDSLGEVSLVIEEKVDHFAIHGLWLWIGWGVLGFIQGISYRHCKHIW